VGQDQRPGAVSAGLRARQPDLAQRGHAAEREQLCRKSGRTETQWEILQGYQMVYFKTKNHIMGQFWRALDWKMLI
jgi:hypothetical protein